MQRFISSGKIVVEIHFFCNITRLISLVMEVFYNEQYLSFYTSFGISKETFTECWKAVYHISMPALQRTVSSNLVDTIRFYRQHKVSGLRLVANYCQYNKHRTQIEDAFNPWVEFEQAIKGKVNAAEGISIAESTFNKIENIWKEKPSDVIRAALYPFPKLFGKRSDFNVRSKYDADSNAPFSCSSLSY